MPAPEAQPYVAVIGAGPHGVAVATALAEELGGEAVCLLDPHVEALAGWCRRAEAIGMARMRSPWVHHCAPEPMDLYRYARARGVAGTGRAPSVELFVAHARERLRRTCPRRRRAVVRGLFAHERGWDVHLAGDGALRVRRVVVTSGLDPHRRPGLGGVALPDRPAVVADERVAVIGAGHTGASAALHVLDQGGRVDLFAPRGLREQTTDVEPGWFGPKHLRGYARTDPAGRLQRLRGARAGTTTPAVARRLRGARAGTTTPAVARRLRALRPCGRLRVVTARAERVPGVDPRRCVAAAGRVHGPYAAVYEASGYTVSLGNEGLLRGLGLPQVGGLPVLDRHLQAAGGLHIVGALAELELGPAGRNLWGAQRATERLLDVMGRGF